MPGWNQRRKLKKHESPPSSSSTVFTADSLPDSNNEDDDFAPLIASQDQPNDNLEAADQEEGKTLQGRRRSLMRNASSSLSKRWGRGISSNDGNGGRPTPPMRSTSFSLRGTKSPSFMLPKTRFSLARRTLSTKDMMGNGVSTAQGSPTKKKKRSYLRKRCDLPEVKERKESVASSLQNYLDIDEDDEEDHIALTQTSIKIGETVEVKNDGSLSSIIPPNSPTKKKDTMKTKKKKKKKKKKDQPPSSPSTTPSKSVFGSWADKSWGEKSWGNISWGNVNNADVSSKSSDKRKKYKKKKRGGNKTKTSSSKEKTSRTALAPPSPQTTCRPPRSPYSMNRRLPPPSPQIYSSRQIRAAQLKFDGMTSKLGLPQLPAIESPLNA